MPTMQTKDSKLRNHSERPGTNSHRNGLLAGLGDTIRSLRQERGLSQRALAGNSGLSARFIAQLEAGAGNISVSRLADIARALGISLPRIFRFESGKEGIHSGEEAESLRWEIQLELQTRTAEDLRLFLAGLRNPPFPRPGASCRIIALIGLRGAGKSTVGPLLAKALGRSFVELDEETQQHTGLALSEIFELHGESYYREAERRALQGLIARGEDLVVAVSGGGVTHPQLFRLLLEATLTVWLKARPEQYMNRVISQGDRRPMADRPDAMAELGALLEARRPYYEQARLIVDTSNTSPALSVEQLVAGLKELQ